MTMPFGKYKGQPLCDLPQDYLDWLTTIELHGLLRAAVKVEVDRRLHTTHACPPAIAEELIAAGTRHLAKQYHPDVGGSHEAMIEVTVAVAFLRNAVRGLTA